MSTARSSGRTHAGQPLVVDVRTLAPLELRLPPPVRAHDAGRLPSFGGETATAARPVAAPGVRRGAPAEPRSQREPTFDELVRGYGRHRGDEAPVRRRGIARLFGRPGRGPARRA